MGPREFRLISPTGASNHFRFVVGQFPEVNEIEPNSDKAKAQPLKSLPVVVNGQIMQGDLDYFRLSAKAGQMLVFQVEAQSLLPFIADAVPGWNDVCLTLYTAEGRQVAAVDDFRFKPDPVLFYRVPKDGDYLVEVRDVIFRGRPDFVYRLTIGTFPYITQAYPLGGRRGTTAKVELFGVNLGQPSLSLALPADSPPRRPIQITANGVVSNAIPFAVGDTPEVEEKEPNDSPAQAMRVESPVTINGRIQHPGDEDYFVFAARAKQQFLLEVFARRLDSPLDSILTLYNSKGQELMENDDTVDAGEGLLTHHADSRLVYTVPADGDYTVCIRDIQGKGGPEYAYRLVIAPVQQDFFLRVSPDNPQMGQGDTAVITVTAIRKDGFNGEIKLAAEDLPKGFLFSQAAVAEGQTIGVMTITSPPDAAMEFYSPTVVGTATGGPEDDHPQGPPGRGADAGLQYPAHRSHPGAAAFSQRHAAVRAVGEAAGRQEGAGDPAGGRGPRGGEDRAAAGAAAQARAGQAGRQAGAQAEVAAARPESRPDYRGGPQPAVAAAGHRRRDGLHPLGQRGGDHQDYGRPLDPAQRHPQPDPGRHPLPQRPAVHRAWPPPSRSRSSNPRNRRNRMQRNRK